MGSTLAGAIARASGLIVPGLSANFERASGDAFGRSKFLNRAESMDFQKTDVFHMLVVAGLHIGPLAFFSELAVPAIAYAAWIGKRTPVCAPGR